MIAQLINTAKKRWMWTVHSGRLDSMTSMKQFYSYIARVRPSVFLEYEHHHPESLREFQAVADELGLPLENARFLDIGPGFGSSLDVCHELGAKHIAFMEHDPFFYTFNRLKGFTRGYRMNARKNPSRLGHDKYDVIWQKGTLSADRFITRARLGVMHPLHRYPSLEKYLSWMDSLAAPRGHIIFCPHWTASGSIRKTRDVLHNIFTDIMLAGGYEILPFIRGHNSEPHYPVTFHRIKSGAE